MTDPIRDFAEAAGRLCESLRKVERAAIVDPLIARLQRAVAARFRRQAKGRPALSLDAIYRRVTNAAYARGAMLAQAQIGKAPVIEAPRKKRLPTWLAALPGLSRTSGDLVSGIDATSRDAVAGLSAADAAAQYSDWASSRAEGIAVTEISRAFHQGMSDLADMLSRQGVQIEKAWDVEDDPCEICLGNVDDGWIPEDILFSSGDDAPTAHPNCRCSLSYRNG